MKIHISGDSWGCGEWRSRGCPPHVVHKGIEQYFLDEGYFVTNTSEGGAGLFNIVHQLQTVQPHDLHICFVTDPFRYIDPKAFWLAGTINTLLKLQNLKLQEFLWEINTLGMPIFLIGGLHKLFPENVKPYKNLKIWVDSFPELVVKGAMHPKIQLHDPFIKWLDEKENRKRIVKRDVFNFIWNEYVNWKKITDTDIFPDNYHPNRDAHYKLFKFCMKQMKLLDLV